MSGFWSPVAQGQSTNAAAYTFVAGSAPYIALTTAPKTLSVGDPDDGYYNALPLGFNFYFGGVLYTKVAASTNGFLLLDRNGKASTPGFDNNLATGGNATGLPIIAPLWDDLSLAVGGFRTEVSGTAPNRVFTAEWSAVQWDYNAAGASISMQVKLYENTNAVQFAYSHGTFALNSATASIGLISESGDVPDFISVGGTPAAPTTSSTVAENSISVRPEHHRVYTFTPARTLCDFATRNAPYVPLATAALARTAGTSDNGYYNGIPLGFTFQFRGVSYSTISASTNGWFTFNQNLAGGDFANTIAGHPMGAPLPTVLAPLWDDLDLVDGGFRTSLSGTAPNRVFTAEWYNARWQNTAAAPSLSFQVMLFEGSNRVWYAYSPTTNALAAPSAAIGFNDGGYFRSLNGTGAAPLASTVVATDNLAVRPAAGQVYAFGPANPLVSPLPIELVSFVARRNGVAVLLVWTTALEKNNLGFAVEKSAQGREFRELAFVAGAGSTSFPQAYTFLDVAAPTAAYYRLRQHDTDGTVTYSPVQFVAAGSKSEALAVYPNPARGTTKVENAAPQEPLTLCDALGRPVRRFADGAASLDLSGLQAGLYWLRTATRQVRVAVE